MLEQKLLKVIAAQAMQVDVSDGCGAAGSLPTIQHGELAKEIPGFQLG